MKSLSKIFIAALFSLSVVGCTTDTTDDNSVKTSGTLSVSTLTSQAGGNYAPKNIVAIWVENSSGEYVKSLLVYADEYKRHLTNWVSNSSYDVSDAVTGATVNTHGTRSCTWDGTDVDGNIVADGTYRVCMELTDKNSTGNYHYFEFLKDSVSHTLTPTDVSSFSDISITWTPE